MSSPSTSCLVVNEAEGATRVERDAPGGAPTAKRSATLSSV